MSVYDIIRAPHISEKGTALAERERQVVSLEVRCDANKHQVKEAVEKVFNVKVEAVRTANFRGKVKRRGRTLGKRSDWKKAYVTLKPGHKIEFIEGV